MGSCSCYMFSLKLMRPWQPEWKERYIVTICERGFTPIDSLATATVWSLTMLILGVNLDCSTQVTLFFLFHILICNWPDVSSISKQLWLLPIDWLLLPIDWLLLPIDWLLSDCDCRVYLSDFPLLCDLHRARGHLTLARAHYSCHSTYINSRVDKCSVVVHMVHWCQVQVHMVHWCQVQVH